jgi:4-amino-4-deoxy-L-arabinose transferase-like glycosyltransferase
VSPRNRPAKPRARQRAPEPPRKKRLRERLRPWHGAVLLALLHGVLALLSLDPTLHNGGDNAAYLALARSIMERGTYQELWEPGMRPHVQYPPGWPLMLAGAMTLGIKPWVGFKVLSILCSVAAVVLSYLWARRVSTPGTALAIAAVLAIGPGVVDLARWELSDVPFWCFTMLALWAFARMAATPEPGAEPAVRQPSRGEWGALALASLAVLLAYVTRSAGVPMVIAAAGWLAWRHRWRALGLFAAVVGPFAVAWWVRGRMVGDTSYTGHLWYVDPYTPALGTVTFVGMLSRIGRNVAEYTGDHLPYLLIGSRLTVGAWIVGVAVVLLAAVGWAMRLRRAGLAEIWLPLYLGLVLIWPAEWSGERILLPALPVMLLCAAEVVKVAGRRIGQPLMLGAGLVGVLALGGVRQLVHEVRLSSSCRAAYGPESPHPCLPQEWQDFLSLAASLRGTLPEGAAVLSRKPTLFWAQSGYASRAYPFTNNPDSLLVAARDAHAEYLVLDYLDNVSMMYLAPILMQRPKAFCVMRSGGPGRATLLSIVPGADTIKNVRAAPTGDENVRVPFSYCPGALPGLPGVGVPRLPTGVQPGGPGPNLPVIPGTVRPGTLPGGLPQGPGAGLPQGPGAAPRGGPLQGPAAAPPTGPVAPAGTP